jgi:hypothetical protein
MLCSLSPLKSDALDAVQHLEQSLGKTVLAFSCHTAAPARLTEAQLQRLQEVEKELGVALVALED